MEKENLGETPMANEITRIYQFLRTYNQDGSTWSDAADKNHNGVVSQYELASFLDNNFEWNGLEKDEKNDIIKNFWKAINSDEFGLAKSGSKVKDKHGINGSELDAMTDKINVFEELEKYINNIPVPDFLNEQRENWKKSIRSELTDCITKLFESQNGIKSSEVKTTLDAYLPKILNTTTAAFYFKQIQDNINSILKTDQNLSSYDAINDKTLNAILSNILNNMDQSASAADIEALIRNSINSYLATADVYLPGVDKNNVQKMQFNSNEHLNDLQKAVLKRDVLPKIQQGVQSEPDYVANKYRYDELANMYLTYLLNNTKFGDFEKVKNYNYENFKSDMLKFDSSIKDILSNQDVVKLIDKNLSFLENIAPNTPGYDNVYKDLLNQILNNPNLINADGSINTKALLEAAIKSIETNAALFTNKNDEVSTETIRTVYDTVTEKYDDIETYREAAIAFCQATSLKGSGFAELVKQVFGADYETVINSLSKEDIQTKITELKEKLANYGDPLLIKIDNSVWGSANKQYLYNNPSTADFSINPKGKIKNEEGKIINVDASRITYTSSDTDIATVDGNGNVKFNNLSAGTHSFTLTIMVDGFVVASQNIQVTVTLVNAQDIAKNTSWDGQKSSHLEAVYGHKTLFGHTIEDSCNISNLTDISFTDLYNQNAIIRLHISMDDSESWENAGRIINERLTQLGNLVFNSLSGTNQFDTNLLRKATDTVVKRYQDHKFDGGSLNDDDDGTDSYDLTNNLACTIATATTKSLAQEMMTVPILGYGVYSSKTL